MLTSCSKHDYDNSIPHNSTALLSFNAQQFVSGNSPFAAIMSPFIDSGNKEMKGIDLTQPFYMFEAGDGTLGFCASVSDAYDLTEFIRHLSSMTDKIKPGKDIDDKSFCILNDAWILGVDDYTLLIMGPFTGMQEQQKQMVRMTTLMNQEEERSIKTSVLWEHLQHQQGAMKMVAQTTALPQQLIAPITLLAPKGTNPADVLIEADMEYEDHIVYLHGKTCSYDENVKNKMHKAEEIYKPLTINWQKELNNSIFAGIFMNVNGQDIMPFLNANKSLATMLMTSEAYDRIKGNMGDLAIFINPGKSVDEQMFSAKVKNLPHGNVKNKERLIAVLNLNAVQGPMESFVAPLKGKVNKIIYSVK